MRKPLFVLLLAAVLGGILAWGRSGLTLDPRRGSGSTAQAAAQADRSAPEFPEGTRWLQSQPLELRKLRGQVVVVHFWTFG